MKRSATPPPPATPTAPGQSCQDAALLLELAGRTDEALAWANAALRDYQTAGPGAQTNAANTRELITKLAS